MSDSTVDAVAEMLWEALFTGRPMLETSRPRFEQMARAMIKRFRPTVSTVEQLDALPQLSVVQFRGKALGSRNRIAWQLDVEWFSPGSTEYFPSSYFPPEAFPAVVLWRPDQQAVS